MFSSSLSYASFPVSDTLQIQKETLEEYKYRIQKQGFQIQTVNLEDYQARVKKEGLLNNKNTSVKKKSKFSKFWKAKTIIQKVLLIILGLFLIFVALLMVAIANFNPSIDFSDFNLDGL
jgi:hypothetical protein